MSRHDLIEDSESRSGDQAPEPPSDATSVFELLGDPIARNLLASLKAEPKTARELVATSEGSRPTVYRRLAAFEDIDLVTVRTRIDPDGHHRKEYATDLAAIVFRLEPGRFDSDLRTDTGPYQS